MSRELPAVSVLIPTFNRSRLLTRAMDSVLMQDFGDLELVIIDDCSRDNTPETVAAYTDPRIRYIRNDVNVASKSGDRAHLRRFVNELMRGRYFTVMSDDDYWLSPTRLRRQVEEFEANDNLAMVIGGQLSHYVTADAPAGDRPGSETMTFTLDNIHHYFDLETLTSKTNYLGFHRGPHSDKSFYSKTHLTSAEFLREFTEDAAVKNINVGATLYSRRKFVESGTFASPKSTSWQSGYELLMGPACYGDVVYLNEPAILVEVRQGNASFRLTQVDHYLDSVSGIELAFAKPLEDVDYSYHSRDFLKEMRARAIRSAGRAYVHHTEIHRQSGGQVTCHGMCSAQHLSRMVTCREVLWALAQYDSLGTLEEADLATMLAAGLSPNPADPGVGHDGEPLPLAATLLDGWLEREPRHAEALHLRALVAREQSDLAGAADLLRRAVAARPDYITARLNLGFLLLETGQAQEALGIFREAIRAQRDLPVAHYGLALAFQNLGQWSPALAEYQRALTIAPTYVEAWVALGNALCAVGQTDQAITALRHALTLRPYYGVAYANLGRALRAAGRISEAVGAYREALAKAPDLVWARTELDAILGTAAQPAG
jgi:glycosyltransferase involved in cell wall biosynthesis/Tfp pilus assembly protein PilF